MLQLIDKDSAYEVWVEAWFDLPNGNCVVERFTVTGEPTYAQINAALEFFGKAVLEATLHSLQMSPEFASKYLFPAVVQQHQHTRWN
jgi:hypothetical protein